MTPQAETSHVHYRGKQPQQPSNNAGAAQVQNSEVNIVLLGKTGVGKSATGNNILGKNRFKCGRSLSSVTKTCSKEESTVEGKRVSVIDTPGFFDTTLEENDLAVEIAKSMYLSQNGVQAFLFVLPMGRFTNQEAEIFKLMAGIFGKDVLKHIIMLFTYGDDCESMDLESEMKDNAILSKSVGYSMRCHVFNNKDQSNRNQVAELLQMIDSMVQQNEGCYTNEMYKLANMTTFEYFWKICKGLFIAFVKLLRENISFDYKYWKAKINVEIECLGSNSTAYMSL